MKNKMKTLLISNMYPSKTYPSYGVFVKNIKELLEKQDIDIVGLATINGRTEKKLQKIINYITLYVSFFYNLIFKKFDLAYIHFFGFYAIPFIWTLKLFGKKIVVNIHGSDLLAASKFTNALQQKTLSFIDLMILPSKYFENKLYEKLPKINNDKVYIYPSGGINTTVFHKQDRKRLLDKHNLKDIFTIGYVSHINNNKGWHEFIKATEKFKVEIEPEIQVLIVGTGQNEKEFNEVLTSSNIKEITTRYKKLTQPELSEIFNMMNIYVFPTRENESLGLVGLESMACGVPVIGSNIGGLPSYIDDKKDSYLVNVGDVDDIYEKLKTYYYLSDLEKETLSENAIKKAQKYEADSVTKLLKNKFMSIGG